MEPPLPLPGHVEATLQAIGRLHTEHYDDATPLQRVVNRLTAILARPAAFGILAFSLCLWMGSNLVLAWTGHRPFDPYPFDGLDTFATVGALCATVLILVTQRHSDDLASRREQLILQLTMASDQKSAKIIQLLEELRRDDPMLRNREDRQAKDMSQPSDPEAVIEAIKDAVEPG